MAHFPKPQEGSWTEHYPGLGTKPVSYYDSISQEFYDKEQQAIFLRTWLNIGRVEDLPRNGSYFTRELEWAKKSILVTKDGSGKVRAFHNICRHRGNKLVWTDFPREETSGTCRQFVCKYHGWKYELDGSLTFVQQEDEFFGLDRHVGFTSVLLHEAQLDDVLRSAPEFPNLSILSAGPLAPNPSELLGSEGFAEIIRRLAADHSVVLLDSPPVLPVTDAVVLSRVADATIVVTSSGLSSKRRVQRAVSSLRQVGAPLVGTVLGSAPHEIAYGYVDYGYVPYGQSNGAKNGFGRSRSSARARTRTGT
mgnify:CR=1 FL=1